MALGSIQAETCELFTSLWKVCSQNCYHNTAVTWPNPHPKRNTTASMPTIDRLPAIIVSQCHMAYINICNQVLFLTETASCLAVRLLKLASWTDWIYSDTVNQRQLICALQDNTVTYKQLHVPKWRPMYTILRSFGLTPPCQMAEECGRSVSENVGRSRCSTLWAQNIHRVARVLKTTTADDRPISDSLYSFSFVVVVGSSTWTQTVAHRNSTDDGVCICQLHCCCCGQFPRQPR